MGGVGGALWALAPTPPDHDILFKGAIARKRQGFEKMAQKSKPAFDWLKIRHRNALAHCARSYSRADAYHFVPLMHTQMAKSSVNVRVRS